jgi:hypothetical protein
MYSGKPGVQSKFRYKLRQLRSVLVNIDEHVLLQVAARATITSVLTAVTAVAAPNRLEGRCGCMALALQDTEECV